MRRLLPLSLLLCTGCAHPAGPEAAVNQAVKARYWATQEAQRKSPPGPAARVRLRQPARLEDGALRVPSTVEIFLPHSP
jgi:hypothetical protein